jgi:hypothetical protein
MSDSQSSKQVVLEKTPEQVSIQEFIGRNSATMVKLSIFSASLFALPILTFFCTLHSLFDGKKIKIYLYVCCLLK